MPDCLVGDEGGVWLPQQELEGERRRRRENLSQDQVSEILVFAGNKINSGERESISLANQSHDRVGDMHLVARSELENYFHLLLGFGFAAGGADDDGLLLAAQAGSLSNSSRREISFPESIKALILQ